MRDGSTKRAAQQRGKPEKRRAVAGNGSAASRRQVAQRQRLVVRHVDIRSVLRLSIVFYLCPSCVILVAAAVLWGVATVTGVRSNVEKFVGDLVVAEDFRLVGTKMLELGAVLSATIVVLGTATNLVMATLYNLISDVIGGFSVVVDGSGVTTAPPDAADAGDGELISPRRPEPVPPGRSQPRR